MSRFPKLSETFILREMLELERQGQPVVVLPLMRGRSNVRHGDVDRLMPRVHHTPLVSVPILAANLHYLCRVPGRYLGMLWQALRGSWGSANLFLGAVGIFPKSVYFARFLETQGIRHVHAHFLTHPALAALVASELAGTTFSISAHAHDFFVDTQMLGEKMRRARFVVTHARFNREYLLRLCPDVPPERIRVIHDGIELEHYGRQPRRAGEPFTILCVASLQPYKGVGYLVRACALLRDRRVAFRCLLVGEGEERRRIERLIADLGLEDVVQVLGGQPQDRVAALLAEADLFAAPSVVAPDGQMDAIPVAVLEAMAAGLPVVSTRLSAIPEAVEHDVTGLLVPPADAPALADAIALLYEQKLLRETMGRRGREKVAAGFQLAPTVAQLRALYQGVLAEESEAAAWRRAMPEAIRERLRQHAPDGRIDDARVDVLARRGSGRDSVVYDVRVRGRDGWARDLILKLHRPAAPGPDVRLARARECAQREHEALAFLWPEFSRCSSRLSVPRPLGCFPESAALLMERCDGHRFDRALRWARLRTTARGRAALYRQAEACGEWLALFHRITARPGDPSVIYRRIEREFRTALAACQRLGLEPVLADRLAARVEWARSRIFTGDHAIVGCHGDFGPYNIWLDRGRVAVIDFEGLRDGLLYEDLCSLLALVDSTSSHHLSDDLRRGITERVVVGYAQQQPLGSEQLEVFRIIAMAKVMAGSPPPPAHPEGRVAWWRRRAQLRLYADWFGGRLADGAAG